MSGAAAETAAERPKIGRSATPRRPDATNVAKRRMRNASGGPSARTVTPTARRVPSAAATAAVDDDNSDSDDAPCKDGPARRFIRSSTPHSRRNEQRRKALQRTAVAAAGDSDESDTEARPRIVRPNTRHNMIVSGAPDAVPCATTTDYAAAIGGDTPSPGEDPAAAGSPKHVASDEASDDSFTRLERDVEAGDWAVIDGARRPATPPARRFRRPGTPRDSPAGALTREVPADDASPEGVCGATPAVVDDAAAKEARRPARTAGAGTGNVVRSGTPHARRGKRGGVVGAGAANALQEVDYDSDGESLQAKAAARRAARSTTPRRVGNAPTPRQGRGQGDDVNDAAAAAGRKKLLRSGTPHTRKAETSSAKGAPPGRKVAAADNDSDDSDDAAPTRAAAMTRQTPRSATPRRTGGYTASAPPRRKTSIGRANASAAAAAAAASRVAGRALQKSSAETTPVSAPASSPIAVPAMAKDTPPSLNGSFSQDNGSFSQSNASFSRRFGGGLMGDDIVIDSGSEQADTGENTSREHAKPAVPLGLDYRSLVYYDSEAVDACTGMPVSLPRHTQGTFALAEMSDSDNDAPAPGDRAQLMYVQCSKKLLVRHGASLADRKLKPTTVMGVNNGFLRFEQRAARNAVAANEDEARLAVVDAEVAARAELESSMDATPQLTFRRPARRRVSTSASARASLKRAPLSKDDEETMLAELPDADARVAAVTLSSSFGLETTIAALRQFNYDKIVAARHLPRWVEICDEEVGEREGIEAAEAVAWTHFQKDRMVGFWLGTENNALVYRSAQFQHGGLARTQPKGAAARRITSSKSPSRRSTAVGAMG